MQNFSYHTPTKVLFGRGVEHSVGATLAEAGYKRVLIHYGGGSVVTSGLLKRVTDSLVEAGISYVKLGGVSPNPKIGLVREGIDLAKKAQIDMIVAVGGGSVIDSAKSIGIGLAHGRDPWEMIESRTAPVARTPLAVVLTLSEIG